MIPEHMVRMIKKTGHFVLVTHIRPDGDALGSLFGLADALKSINKEVLCYLQEPIGPLWKFLPGCERATSALNELAQFVDVNADDIAVISLDCGAADRLGDVYDDLVSIRQFVAIDHHIGHQKYADVLWLQPECSATGEMVYQLIEELGASISYSCAYNLYVAICTDTGSFRYDSTTPKTMRIAADLMERGIKPDEVAHRLYDNYSLNRLRLLEKVLATLQLYESRKVAVIYVTRAMFEATGASENDTEDFINFPRSLQTVKVAVFLKEIKQDVISVSMRAKGTCDVARIAAIFGGGGHRNAAGCRFFDTNIDQVRKELLPVLRRSLS